MAEETGIMLSSSGGKERIRLHRKTEYSTCGGCFFSKTEHFTIAEAEGPIGDLAGDTVWIAKPDQYNQGGVLAVYVAPQLVHRRLYCGVDRGSSPESRRYRGLGYFGRFLGYGAELLCPLPDTEKGRRRGDILRAGVLRAGGQKEGRR